MSDGQILFCQKINCKIKMMKPFVLALILILINAQIARCQVLYGSYTEKAFGYFVKPSMAAYIALIDDKEPKDKGVNNVHLIYIEKIDTSKMSIPTLSYIIVNANYDFNAYKNSADLKFCRKEDNNLWFLAFAPDVDSGYVNSFSFFGEKYKQDSIYKYSNCTESGPKYYFDNTVLFYNRQDYESKIDVYFSWSNIPDDKKNKGIFLMVDKYYKSFHR